jgi:hypothetical protein
MKVNIVYDDFRTSFSYSLDITWYEVCLKLIECHKIILENTEQ